jgi:mevalonate kinase
MGTKQSWHSHGKLLLSGEYLVMEGARALALPLKPGQSLTVKENELKGRLIWHAFTPEKTWFTAEFETENFNVLQTGNLGLAENLGQILRAVRKLAPAFLQDGKGFSVETKLDFNPEFGFGSSSTLISNLAWWADVDPYHLLRLTFGGSAYDIACARMNNPIFYQLESAIPVIEEISFKPEFRKQLYFVYLGKKQKSTESIQSFNKTAVFGKGDVETISLITEQIAKAESLRDFERLLNEHEKIMSTILGRPTVKSLLFSDYEGTVKSLGGWGGDFVLVTSVRPEPAFRADMRKRGFPLLFAFDEVVL